MEGLGDGPRAIAPLIKRHDDMKTKTKQDPQVLTVSYDDDAKQTMWGNTTIYKTSIRFRI